MSLNDFLPLLVVIAGTMAVVGVVYVLDRQVFKPRRENRKLDVLETRQKQAVARESFLEATDEKHLLLSIYEAQKDLLAEQQEQTRQLRTISGAAQLWLVLTIIGLLIGCVIAFLGGGSVLGL